MADVNINAAVVESVRHEEQASDIATPAVGFWKTYFKEGGLYWVDDAGVVAGPLGSNFIPSGRLTLTTATPVTTADVTAAATLYYTPYTGNMISLYDGARWIPVVFTEKSLSIAAFTASKPYDIFGYLSSGTLALEGLVWTDATNRATALAYQNGRLVKSGAATRLYLGTIYINASGGQTDDSLTIRSVWNYYNRRPRPFYINESTAHTYNSTNIRNWNNAALAISFICGVVEDAFVDLSLWFYGSTSNTASAARTMLTLDAATSLDANMPYVIINVTTAVATGATNVSKYPTLGYHTINVMEHIIASTNNGNFTQAKLSGAILG